MRHAVILSALVVSALLSTSLAATAAPKRSSKERMPPSQLVVVEKYNLLPIIQILNGELDEYLDLVQISNEDIAKFHDRCADIITKSRKIGNDKIQGACEHFYRYAVQPQILVNQRIADYMDRLFKLSESRPVTGEDLKDAIGNCALDLRKEIAFRDMGNLRGDLCEYSMLFWYNEYFGKK
jgi:hypothetical protein